MPPPEAALGSLAPDEHHAHTHTHPSASGSSMEWSYHVGLRRIANQRAQTFSCVLGTEESGPSSWSTKRRSAVATVVRTKELKKRYGAEEGEESSRQSWKEVVSRERLFLSQPPLHVGLTLTHPHFEPAEFKKTRHEGFSHTARMPSPASHTHLYSGADSTRLGHTGRRSRHLLCGRALRAYIHTSSLSAASRTESALLLPPPSPSDTRKPTRLPAVLPSTPIQSRHPARRQHRENAPNSTSETRGARKREKRGRRRSPTHRGLALVLFPLGRH